LSKYISIAGSLLTLVNQASVYCDFKAIRVLEYAIKIEDEKMNETMIIGVFKLTLEHFLMKA